MTTTRRCSSSSTFWRRVFQKSPAEAYRIMMQVHLNGRGVAGIYPWEVAETKVDTLLSLAREAGHPLQATIEDA